jgi:hypothetical protein
MIAGRFHFTHSVMNQPGRGREGCVKSTWILKKVPYSTCFEFFTATGTYNISSSSNTWCCILIMQTNSNNVLRTELTETELQRHLISYHQCDSPIIV